MNKQYSSRQEKKDPKSNSMIMRAAFSISNARAIAWVSACQMTPAQHSHGMWLLPPRICVEPPGAVTRHQSEGSGKGHAQRNHGGGLPRDPELVELLAWIPAPASCGYLILAHENCHLGCTKQSHGAGCRSVSRRPPSHRSS